MIELSNLSRHYSMADSDVAVLRQLSLSVQATERVAIVGPSGSGKTTLLLILTGLESPSDGTVEVAQQNLTSMTPDQRADLRREHIGIVFQSFHLIPTLTARENVALPLEIGGGRDSRKRAMMMLDRVGLAERGTHYPAQLSGGEQQRVAIARAYAPSPSILFADEPTGNLDRATGERIVDLLMSLNTVQGTTLFIVTHDMALANRCDRVFSIESGRIKEVTDA